MHRDAVKRILLVVSSAPLVPGPLYGLRTWRVVTHDGRERLSAPQRGTPWTLGEGWIEATCGEDHRAPAAGCGCGIHAWHPRRASARRILRSRFDLPGIVEADGAVEVHEEGFRAQRARPYAFVRVPGRNPFLIERLAAAYGAEVLDLRRAEELLAVCRERSLGLQEPVVEELIGAEAIAERRRARARQRRNDALRVVAALLVVAIACALALAVLLTRGREVRRRAVRVDRAALGLLPFLLAPEGAEVEEVVRAARHLAAAPEGRVRVEDALAVAQEVALAGQLERLIALDVVRRARRRCSSGVR